MTGSALVGTLRRWLRVEHLEDRTTPTAVVVDTSSFAADRVLVTLADGADAATAVARLSASPLTAGVQHLGFGIYQVNLRAGVSVQQAVPALDAIRGIASAEADYAIGLTATPTDPSFGSTWGLHNAGQSGGAVDADIDATEAWDKATGTGQTVVAVIDTGVDYTHPDLAANMWRNPGEVAGDGLDNDGNLIVDDIFGADFANNDGDPMDDNNHGTHCAGTIGAVANNGVGVAGVAWKTRIMAMKFLTASGSGSTSNAIKCIDYAIAKGAKILSNSWGGGGYSSALEAAIVRSRDAGAVFVAAAGNNGANTDVSANYPSNYAVSNVVSVAATDHNDQLASFSNYGANTVDLGAPGVSVLSTVRGGGYSSFSGTSMATPHVAGALAVYWDKNPGMTAQQVIQKLLGSVDSIASLAGKTVTGGRLNLNKMLEGGSPLPPPPPPPPGDTTGARVTTANFAGSTASNYERVRLTFSEAINAASFDATDVVLTGPSGGAIAVQGVKLVDGTTNQFDVTFATQTAFGTYAIGVGPQVLDLANNPMDQNQNGQNGEATADRYTGTAMLYPGRQKFSLSGLNVPIRDFTTSTVTINVPASSVVNGFTVTDLNVTLSLSHTYTSDLVITLTAPNGKAVTLFNRRGGSGDHLTNTTFNDEATTLIRNGRAPFTGSFRPEALLSGFDGVNPVGNWTLSVRDAGRSDVGTITAVSLDIATNPADAASGMTFGMTDEPATDAPAVGPGVAGSFGSTAPALLAPTTTTTRATTPPVAPPPAADLTILANTPTVAPQFGGLNTFEPTALARFGQPSQQPFNGFTIE
jgi:subtilisin family serine protease/subtilisin-like proprotein convertase family protein